MRRRSPDAQYSRYIDFRQKTRTVGQQGWLALGVTAFVLTFAWLASKVVEQPFLSSKPARRSGALAPVGAESEAPAE